jgi:hypothetical protein
MGELYLMAFVVQNRIAGEGLGQGRDNSASKRNPDQNSGDIKQEQKNAEKRLHLQA